MSQLKSKRPVVFLGVGVANTLFDFAFYTLLTQTVFRDQSQIAMAGFVSGTLALLVAFTMHSFITWRGSRTSWQTLVRFIVFTGFGMWAIRPLLLALFIKSPGFYSWVYSISTSLHLPFSYSFISHTGAFGLMAAIVLAYNYLVYDRFVFNKPKLNGASGSSLAPSSDAERGQE